MGSAGSGQTVVVLGGGIGGVVAANRLRRKLDRRHRVVLVNREADFSFAASYLWVMTGDRTSRQVTRPLQQLGRRGIEVVIGDVEAIDPATRTVRVDGRELAADHLVVSLGAEQVPQTIPGMAEHGHTFATLPGARRLGIELDAIDSGRILVVTGSPVYRCPAAPYEAAFLIDALLRRRGVRDRVEIAVHAAEPMPMGVAGANVSGAVKGMLAARGIEYRPGHQIGSVDAGRAQFVDGEAVPFDLLAYMPPIAPPPVIAASALAGAGGWIEADRHTLRTTHENVYAIGDNVQIPLGIGKPLPRAGVFAHGQAEVVANNISVEIRGKGKVKAFDGDGSCFLMTGGAQAAFVKGTWFSTPRPSIKFSAPSRTWYMQRVLFEKYWLRRWF